MEGPFREEAVHPIVFWQAILCGGWGTDLSCPFRRFIEKGSSGHGLPISFKGMAIQKTYKNPLGIAEESPQHGEDLERIARPRGNGSIKLRDYSYYIPFLLKLFLEKKYLRS